VSKANLAAALHALCGEQRRKQGNCKQPCPQLVGGLVLLYQDKSTRRLNKGNELKLHLEFNLSLYIK
jgi:hypothetical protein